MISVLILVGVMLAQFISVFSLVMNSKLLRDDRWVLAMINSVVISITQFIFVYAVANTNDVFYTFIFAAAGGSLGCGASHHFYTKFIMRK